ncbi:hypothetical protein F8A10_16735 [Paracoccus kondratievae]|uniref:Type III secretion system protein n=1 Tax=Paracoccus kondratievae TaxID=135740 RepID=A0A0G3B822_9RHOB|nr:hypothetical protein [Paracoccus kondratievae]AKJ20440.1 type III secretion system protein [Paracoccus kondratievae]QFQ89055.1 hypothetical protein F8A10_16735 [Paracoccus kondratievae]GLK65363.1 hypothetical protein GCM10017635_28380 [Paracoccus kondratievae]
MVTAVIAVGDADPAAKLQSVNLDASEAAPEMSNIAQAALARITEMDSGYRASAAKLEALDSKHFALNGTGSSLASSINQVSETFRVALEVQTQITQFSMVSSLSQTLSTQLNSFLRGQ